MNSRGQAFSVFELMIAGVVAFAILIILLLILPPVDPILKDAKTVLMNGISSATPSGTVTTEAFAFKQNDLIETVDLLEQTGLDAKSIFFASGQFGAGSSPNSSIEIGSNGTYVKYSGVNKLNAQAKVMCKQTAEQLDSSIAVAFSNSTYKVESNAVDACGDFMPCCVIVLERAKAN